MSREAMKQALEFLEALGNNYWHDRNAAITALRKALEQPADEPVAWMKEAEGMRLFTSKSEIAKRESMNTPLYTRPQPAAHPDEFKCPYCYDQPAAWVGLTDEEMIAFEKWLDNEEEKYGWVKESEIVKYIEAKLKEKNHG